MRITKDHSSCSVHQSLDQGGAIHMNPPRTVLDYKRMKGYGGKEFDGESTDPQVAVDWIRDMNATFDQLGATSDERLHYCVFLL